MDGRTFYLRRRRLKFTFAVHYIFSLFPKSQGSTETQKKPANIQHTKRSLEVYLQLFHREQQVVKSE